MPSLLSNPIAITLLIIVVISVAFIFLILFFRSRAQITRSLNMVLFMVSVPKETKPREGEVPKNEKEMIGVMEQLYTSLSNLKELPLTRLLYGPPTITFEMAVSAMKTEITFYVIVPRRFESIVEKQIHSFFPFAEIKRVEDHNIFNPIGKASTCYLKLSRRHIFPLKTYQDLETDPLNSLTNALSKLPLGQGAAIQVQIRQAPPLWRREGLQLATHLQKGENFSKATRGSAGLVADFAKDIAIGVLTEGKKTKKDFSFSPTGEGSTTLSPMDVEKIKALERKSSKIGFETNIRLLTSAPTQEKADQLLAQLEESFAQFTNQDLNSFVRTFSTFNYAAYLKKLIYDFIFRNFNKDYSVILNTEELASVFHFPIATTETPKVKWLKTKSAHPPANLSETGLVLGRNIYRGEETIVRISNEDRRRHIYAIGQTGTGKSTLFANLVKQDITNDEGVCVIDPHGDLIEDILANIPQERVDDVIIFDPSDIARPIGLNMLECETEEQQDFAIQEMIAIFYKLFPPEMIGPMFEHNMRNVMLTLMEDKEYPGTIAEIPRMFTDVAFQKYKLRKVSDPVVRAFWEKEMAKTSDFHKSEMLGYLISKVGRFVENRTMRNIIGQPRSGFNFRRIMDQGKILLVNLSKGKTGEVNSYLLGLIIVSKLQMAAMSRGDIPLETRKDFYLYVDEFHNFTTDSVATILSEARKYRLNLALTHQFIGQLPENIRDAVFGNIGTLITFRIGAEDAAFVGKQFLPVFNEQDLINLDNFNCYIKLMIGGTTSRPFNMETYPPSKGNIKTAQALKELSRAKFGRPRQIIEKEILERSQLGATISSTPTLVPGERKM